MAFGLSYAPHPYHALEKGDVKVCTYYEFPGGFCAKPPDDPVHQGLYAEELAILDHIAEAVRLFQALPVEHEFDNQEFCHAIHQLQRIVMARETRRRHPERFRNLQTPSSWGMSER